MAGAGAETETGVVAPWRVLPWDSAFFGISIGRIDLDGADADALAAAESDARAAGVRCLYGELGAGDGDGAALDLLQRRGYRLVDVAFDLVHATSVLVDPPPTVSSVRLGTPDDVPRLADQIAVVAPWSRYAVDPRFGEGVAGALHRAWVARAASGEDGRRLLVAEDAAGITAMSTVCLPIHEAGAVTAGRIDLIAATSPRSGAAQALVGHAFTDFGPGPSDGGPIPARNLASLRFSLHLGYRFTSARHLFHRWLDEATPTC